MKATVLGPWAVAPLSVVEVGGCDLACTARGFMVRQCVPVLKGIVGAVDGILVAIRSPSILEHWKPMSFWCRKQYNALNMQCVSSTMC